MRGLRLFRFRPDDGVKPALALADVGVAAKEIHRAGAEAEQRRNPGVVVIRLGEMAVLAIFCRAHAAGGVRQMRIVGLAAETVGADRLLLRIDPLAICILRTDDDRAG